MDPLDSCWCPVCDRQILPKRYNVPVAPAPAPPAPAPAAAPVPVTRTKSNNGARTRGGLVHGTGRAKATAAALKRTSSKTNAAPAPAAVAEPPKAPAAPVKTKPVIDQGPVPLYCSDQCRLEDLHRLSGGLPHYYDPVRHDSAEGDVRSVDVDVEADSASDPETASTSTSHTHSTARSYQEMDKSVATLAALYGFPALPPPPPPPSKKAEPRPVSRLEDFNSGTIMAGRRIKEKLCPDVPKRSPAARWTSGIARDRAPIPGWTDGSDAWRQDVYSLSAPKDWSVVNPRDPENKSAFYKTSVATTHRSTAGVVSTLGDGSASAHSSSPRSAPTADGLVDLFDAYNMINPARERSRAMMYPGTSAPSRSSSSLMKREVNILPPQAEGKLLVPNVKLRRNTSSTSINSTTSSYYNPRSPRANMTRRGSGMSDETIPEDRAVEHPSSSFPTTRPVVPSRVKTADDLLTYPVYMPMVRETRIERREVDGVMTDVEVEVMVPKEIEPLFLGPDGVNPKRARRLAQRALSASGRA